MDSGSRQASKINFLCIVFANLMLLIFFTKTFFFTKTSFIHVWWVAEYASVTPCLSTLAEFISQSSAVKIDPVKSIPGEKDLDFLSPRWHYIT